MNTVNKRKITKTKPRERKLSELEQAQARIRELEMDSYVMGELNKVMRSKLGRIEWLIPLVNEIELAMRRLKGG